MDTGLVTGVHRPEHGVPFPGAGSDNLLLRLTSAGPDTLTVVEDTSSDRDWAPFHRHPWDELTYVLDGTLEFRVGTQAATGGPGTLVSLPRGVPHTLRVPEGSARFLMITIGAPSAGFLREVGEAYAKGPTLEQLVAIARRHGVELSQEPEAFEPG